MLQGFRHQLVEAPPFLLGAAQELIEAFLRTGPLEKGRVIGAGSHVWLFLGQSFLKGPKVLDQRIEAGTGILEDRHGQLRMFFQQAHLRRGYLAILCAVLQIKPLPAQRNRGIESSREARASQFRQPHGIGEILLLDAGVNKRAEQIRDCTRGLGERKDIHTRRHPGRPCG